MKKKLKLLLCLILSVSMLLPCLVSCKSEWEKEGEKVIGTCGEYDVLYEELRFVTLFYKASFEETYGEGIWDDPTTAEQYRDELEALVWEKMLSNYVVLAACSNYKLTREDLESKAIQDAVDEQIQEAIEACEGKKEFQKTLQESYMTENLMRFMLGVEEMKKELSYVLKDDLGMIMKDQKEFLAWLDDGNVAYVQHVFIRNDAGDDPEANRALAQTVADTLRASDDVQKTLASYIGNGKVHEDPSNLAPYYVMRNAPKDAVSDAALALPRDGAVSDPIESAGGFYVLVRMSYTSDKLLLRIPDLLQTYQAAKLDEEIQRFKEQTSITLNEYGESLDLLKIQ